MLYRNWRIGGQVNMTENKKYISPGCICTLDPENKMSQDFGGCIQVEIIRAGSKKNIFGNKESTWICRNAMSINDNEVEIPESLLVPSGCVIVRNPPDMPTINDMDIDALSKVIDLLNQYDAPEGTEISKETIQRLTALREKLIFYGKMRQV